MERLTEWSYLAGVMVGDLKAGVDERKAFDRLAAYEDTGLEPEDVTSLMASHGTAILALSEYRSIGSVGRFKKFSQTEKDGRLMVLPCKVGDRVYRVITARDATPVMTEIEIKTFGQAADLIGRIGEKQLLVSWYLTREEAEAALKKREEADHEAI